jgi:uncharacterized protein YkwD
MIRKKTLTALLTIALCAGMSAPAYAAQNPLAYMEAQSRQAVESAIKAKTVPPGTTIYDCMYGADQNGNIIVIQYRDQDGNWVDVITGKKKEVPPGMIAPKLSKETLAEYAAEGFRLTNAEREKAGLEPLERDNLLDEAAMIRAAEVIVVDKAGGKPHTRPDGTSYRDLVTDMGSDGMRCGENIARAEATAQFAIEAWMRSDGHRENMLREDYGSMGIGVYQLPDGSLDWVQIFMLK